MILALVHVLNAMFEAPTRFASSSFTRLPTGLLATVVVVGLSSHPALAAEPIRLPSGQAIDEVDFDKHVAPLISRLGCNSGSCHGASDGQGGFRLSLFGHDPVADYLAMTEFGTGRIDSDEPSESRLLAKPTLTIDHEGGLRLHRESWEYAVVSRWIAEGARRVDHGDRSAIDRLSIEPAVAILTDASPTVRVRVIARFADGTESDVTPFSTLRVQDEAIVSIDREGTVTRHAPGDTHVIATYNGQPANTHVLAPRPSTPAQDHRRPTASGLIDRHVDDRLDRLGIPASPRCSDETFLRRVSLATVGQLPSPEAVVRFVSHDSAGKRERLIDGLLADPLHAARLATRMCEITGSGDVPDRLAQRKWHAWFRTRFAQNVSYDKIVRGVLSSTTRQHQSAEHFIVAHTRRAKLAEPEAIEGYAGRATLDLYWQRPNVNDEIDLEAVTERTAAAFLGVRIECARCHKHPFDRWTQRDYLSLANVFSQVRYGLSPETRSALADALQRRREMAATGRPTEPIPRIREVYAVAEPSHARDPKSGDRLPAKLLGDRDISQRGDRRAVFVDWLTEADNPYFAPNFVNRLWAWYFGVGLVDPVDAFSAGNPVSHPKLLAELSRDFVEHGYDVRRLERQILNSQAWQRSTKPNGPNASDRRNFARAQTRVLAAEVVVDALGQAIGDQRRRAVEIAERMPEDGDLKTYFEIFDRPERKLTCDCERDEDPTLRQTMLLLSDEKLIARIREGYVATLVKTCRDDGGAVDRLFLRTLSRRPSETERDAALRHLDEADTRLGGMSDILWGLLNTREFVTNH